MRIFSVIFYTYFSYFTITWLLVAPVDAARLYYSETEGSAAAGSSRVGIVDIT